MRILHFFKTYWPDTYGGIERTIQAIAKGTEKYGIDSEVLSLSKEPQSNTQRFDGHMAYKSKLDFEFASTGFSRDVFGRFRQLSRDADIIHFHFPWPLMDIVHLTSGHGKPTLVTYHSDVVKQKVLLRLYQPLMMHFLSSVDQIVATSPNYLHSSPVLQRFKAKTSVIPLGLSELEYPAPSEANKARWRARLPPRFFLFVGVLRYYKGIHILLAAAKISGLPIVIVGDGPMAGTLKEQAKNEDLTNVHFLGALEDEDKLALFDLCLGLAFPSHLRSEAFGLSLVEASIFGKPMISCEIGTGTSFVNLNNMTGLVIPPGDPKALSDAMARIYNDPSSAASFGSAARRRYEGYFTAESMAKSYANLYASILGEK